MDMTQQYAYVNDDTLQAATDGTAIGLQATARGELRVADFYTQMLLQGRMYQVRAGTIATGIAADSAITDTRAQASVDAVAGTTIIPVALHVSFRDVATALTAHVALKAVGVVSSAGTAFVPLPLLQGGNASVSTARVATAGVTVTAELATTTRRLFEYINENTETPASATAPAALAGPLASIAAAATQLRYVGKGAACIYLQVASTTAAALHFGTIDYIEIPSVNL